MRALLLAGAIWSMMAFGLAYVIYRRTDNASVVDAIWAFTLGGAGVLYAGLGAGDPMRRLAVALMAGTWGVRLGWHLVQRIRSGPEDARYERLREEWRVKGYSVHWHMARFYAGQALSVVVLSLPFALVAREARAPELALLTATAMLFLVALLGESIADAQLRRYKARAHAAGGICDQGLWAWSRHPNYFFEWLVWVAFALLALDTTMGWTALFAPLAMLYLLLRVTGIPLTEARLLASRGDAFRAYQQRVSRFVPRPPRPR